MPHGCPKGAVCHEHRVKVRRWLKENAQLIVSTEEDYATLDPCVVPSTRLFAGRRSYDPAKPLMFMHVPKCCGTSLIQALVVAGIARSAFSGFDEMLFGDFTAFESLSEQLRLSIYLNTNDLPKRTAFVAAHMSFSTLSRGFPGGQLLTLLREPVSRLLSLWLFWRSHTDEQLRDWGRWGDRVRNSRHPLVDFLRATQIACQTDNQLLRLLLWPHRLIPRNDFIDDRHDATLIQAAAERLTRFSFVDLIENQTFESSPASWLGRPIALGKFNQTANIPQSLKTPLAYQLTDEAWALLEARSRLDLKLWLALAAERVPQIDAQLLRRKAMATTIGRHSQLMAR
jgi:Sulfotransferase family